MDFFLPPKTEGIDFWLASLLRCKKHCAFASPVGDDPGCTVKLHNAFLQMSALVVVSLNLLCPLLYELTYILLMCKSHFVIGYSFNHLDFSFICAKKIPWKNKKKCLI
jgi:hypothetical protein